MRDALLTAIAKARHCISVSRSWTVDPGRLLQPRRTIAFERRCGWGRSRSEGPTEIREESDNDSLPRGRDRRGANVRMPVLTLENVGSGGVGPGLVALAAETLRGAAHLAGALARPPRQRSHHEPPVD